MKKHIGIVLILLLSVFSGLIPPSDQVLAEETWDIEWWFNVLNDARNMFIKGETL